MVAVATGAAAVAVAQSPPSLGSSSSFAVLAGSRVTSSGATILAGNAGVSPGASIGGLSSSNFVIGGVFTNDALARRAQSDQAAAFQDLGRLPCGTTLPSALGARTLGPDVYCAGPATLSGRLTLDAGGNPDAVWIFKVDSLTTAAASAVDLPNGGKDGNVFWRIDGAAAFGANSYFLGNVLARSDIDAGSGANVAGRLLSQNGAVSLRDSSVTICCDVLTMLPRMVPGGTVGTPYAQTLAVTGGVPPYRLAVVAGQLPPGIAFAANGTLSGVPTAEGRFRAAIVATDSEGVSCIRVYTISVCRTITLSPLLDPAACAFYEQRITASGGTEPYVFTAPDSLPPGFRLTSDGVLSGTTTPGVYTFPVTATDAAGCSGSRTYVLRVSGELTLLPPALPDGSVGTAYEARLRTMGGTGPFTFAVTEGRLPAGLELLEDGTLRGTPSAGGCFTFTVTATNGVCAVKRDYSLVICPVTVVFSPETLPDGTACEEYPPTPITAAGCTGPYTLTAEGLPDGLRFDPPGVITGMPVTPGTYDFTVIVSGARGCTARRDYRIYVGCGPLDIERELPPAATCTFYEHRLTATGACPAPLSFSAPAGTLPSGLVLSPEGVISGTPTTAGDYTFDLTVTAPGCPPSMVTLHLPVACVLTLSPRDLPPATVGVGYDQPLTPCGGLPPYSFTVISGALPPGLLLDLDDGAIAGIPIGPGCSTFTIGVTDSAECSGEQTYELCVDPLGPAVPALSGWMLAVLCALLAGMGVIAARGGSG